MSRLSVPKYISLDREYMPGIGKHELRRLLISIIPGSIAAIILWFVLSDPFQKLITVFAGIAYVAACYGIFAKVDRHQSVYTYVAMLVRY